MEREVLQPTVTFFLEEREPKKDGTIPLKIRITWKRKRKYFAIKRNYMESLLRKNSLSEFIIKGKGEYSIEKELFMKATGADGKKPYGKYKQLLQVFNEAENDAKRIAEQCTPNFSFDLFQELYYGSSASFSNNVFHYFESHIETKRDNGNVRTAVSYECTMS